jgi:hypothetical protein
MNEQQRNPEDIRADQQRFGRSQGDTTLHAKPGYRGDKPRKFMPKGHDAILARLQDAKAEVALMAISGVGYIGTIVTRDKFTITMMVKTTDDQGKVENFDPPIQLTFYKHGIESFGSRAAQ